MTEGYARLIIIYAVPAFLTISLIILYIKDFGATTRVIGFLLINSLGVIVPVFSYFASKRMVNDLFPEVVKKIDNQGPLFTKSDVIQFHEAAVGLFIPFAVWFFVAILGMFLAGILIGKRIRSANFD